MHVRFLIKKRVTQVLDLSIFTLILGDIREANSNYKKINKKSNLEWICTQNHYKIKVTSEI